MTSAQTRYWELREAVRHNTEQENYWGGQLKETVRHDQAQESLSRYATDTQRDTALATANISAEASKYAADRHYQATAYSADTSAAASRYATLVNAETQQEISLRNTATSLANVATQAETSKYVADTSASASRYAADTSANASIYRTDTEAANFQARLKFDQSTQQIRNVLAANELSLKRDLTDAQVKELTQRTAASIEQLKLTAERLDLDKQAQYYQNKLTQARTLEAYASSGRQAAQAAQGISKLIMDILDYTKEVNNNG